MYKDPHKKYLFLFVVFFLGKLFKFLYSVCFWLVVYTTSVQGPLSNNIVSAQLDFTTQPTAESQSRVSFPFL